MPKKILVIRLSSIGDILLTSPVLRCLKTQVGAEVDFLTREKYFHLLSANPNLDQLIAYRQEDLSGLIQTLKSRDYELVVDLHKNLRTLRLKRRLGVRATTFNKVNLKKWLAVRTKNPKVLPALHVVERYFGAIHELGVAYDGEGLDFYFSKDDKTLLAELANASSDIGRLMSNNDGYVAVVMAAAHQTKAIPSSILSKILASLPMRKVLVGGSDYQDVADALETAHEECISMVGKTTVEGSAFLLRNAAVVLTPDTGMMHLAAALKKPIVSIWGNTIPEFGMYPFLPGWYAAALEQRFEVSGLLCRPCSKIGYNKCPKGHFRCMMEQDVGAIVETIERLFNYAGPQEERT